MNCTIVYGMGSDLKRQKTLPAADAFRMIRDGDFWGWAFVNVYYNDRLVYTTQGMAGRLFYCSDCPYHRKDV